MDDKKTILIVDDEATLRSVFCDMMSAHGYRCLTAANAIDALQIIEANLFKLDMLMTDIKMPGQINGLDLAKRLRETQPDVAILLITGHAQSPLMTEAKALGYRILEKPFRQLQLEAVIAEQLGETRDGRDVSGTTGASVSSIEHLRQGKR